MVFDHVLRTLERQVGTAWPAGKAKDGFGGIVARGPNADDGQGNQP